MLGKYFERESLGRGRYIHTQHIDQIAYDDNGWKPIISDWLDGGDGSHIITASPFLVTVNSDGGRNLHPTRELDKFVTFERPWVKSGVSWIQPAWNQFTREGNLLSSINQFFNAYFLHYGPGLKFGFLLKNYIPQDRLIAFPVGLTGLTRQGTTIYDGENPVMRMRPLRVWDHDLYGENEPAESSYPIAHELVNRDGQWYIQMTLPIEVTGMTVPFVDPTFETQPDAAAGKDTVLYDTQDYDHSTNQILLIAQGTRHSVFEFDLSSIPSGATCLSAVFTLKSLFGGTHSGSVYSLHSNVSTWTEVATWSNYKAATAWPGSSGALTAGVDYESGAIGTFSQTGAGYVNMSLSPSRIAEWFGAVNTNYGVTIGQTGTINVQVYSSDYTVAADRPKLTVEYSTHSPLPRHERI